MKKSLLAVALLSIGTGFALAEPKYDKDVGNPFVFCSLPKPCKHCQPWRSKYEDICESNRAIQQQEQIAEDPAYMTRQKFNDAYNAITASANALASGNSLEVDQYINWLATQPGPNGFNGTMGQFWLSPQYQQQASAQYGYQDGVVSPQNDPAIRASATLAIQQMNNKMMDSISNGYMPAPKPWL
mgnify:CR=1 FL=1